MTGHIQTQSFTLPGTDKRKLIVIGKSARPRCFKNVASLPVTYFANKKAWMTNVIFKTVLQDLDKDMISEKRKIILFLDNCSAHGSYAEMQKTLKAVKLAFFPANTTSHLQPLDQGIIQSLKVHYRSKLLRAVVAELGDQRQLKSVNILEAINIVSQCWNLDVTPTCINNCFRKAGFDDVGGFSYPDIDPVVAAEYLRADYEAYLARINYKHPSDMLQDYAVIDDGVAATVNLTDAEIIDSIKEGDAEDGDEFDVEVEEPPIPITDAVKSVSIIRKFLQQQQNVGIDLFMHVDHLERELIGRRVLHQKTMDDFFIPVPVPAVSHVDGVVSVVSVDSSDTKKSTGTQYSVYDYMSNGVEWSVDERRFVTYMLCDPNTQSQCI